MENIGNFRSFRKSNNKQIHIPRKLTGVPGCVKIMEQILTLEYDSDEGRRGCESETRLRLELRTEGGRRLIGET